MQAAADMESRSATGWALAVAVGLGADGTSVALCLERPPSDALQASGRERAGDEADEGATEQQGHGSQTTT